MKMNMLNRLETLFWSDSYFSVETTYNRNHEVTHYFLKHFNLKHIFKYPVLYWRMEVYIKSPEGYDMDEKYFLTNPYKEG